MNPFKFLHLNWVQVNLIELLGLLVPGRTVMTYRRNKQGWYCQWRDALDPSFFSRKPCSVTHLLSPSQCNASLFYLEDTKCIYSVNTHLGITRNAGEVMVCLLKKYVSKMSCSRFLSCYTRWTYMITFELRLSCDGMFSDFLLALPLSLVFIAVVGLCYPGKQKTFSGYNLLSSLYLLTITNQMICFIVQCILMPICMLSL